MPKESKKTSLIRPDSFFRNYLSGKVIDIGGGNDPVIKNAEIFDLAQGDAQYILRYKPEESYDCVYSSHCLEHMRDVTLAISQWWKLVKVNGYMIIVVPHEDLYEQGVWPSIFNKGHCATFRLKSEHSWSPNSYDLHMLSSELPNAQILESEIQDLNYDHNLRCRKFIKIGHLIYRWQFKKNVIKQKLSKKFYSFLHGDFFIDNKHGKIIDQTASGALAQIQIVIKKHN